MRGKTHCTIGILSIIQVSLCFNIPISIFNFILAALFSILPDLDEPNSKISEMIVKKNTSKIILKSIVYIISIIIFFVFLKINNDFFLSSLITFILIIFLESRLNYLFLKKLLISLLFILLGFSLYPINSNIYFFIFCLMISIFPWLKHRGFSHSIFAILMIYFLLNQIQLVTNISHLSLFGTISYASHIFLGDIFTKSGVPIFYPINKKRVSLASFKVGSSSCNLFEYCFIISLIIIIFLTFKR